MLKQALPVHRYTVVFLVFLFLGGCAPPPIPVPMPTTGDLHSTESEIDALIAEAANRYEVIVKLGYPDRQNNKQASYKACIRHAGIVWLGPDATTGRERECYELVLEFDVDGKLMRYYRKAFSGKFTTSGRLDISDMRLLAGKGISEAQWDLYNDYGRKPDDLIWLCRSADNGYAKAQLRVANVYMTASDIQKNKINAYVWYKLAKTGNGILVTTNEQHRAAYHLGRIELTPAELKEAEMMYENWQPGQCERDLVLGY
jgi:TPR repeat protein